MFGAAVMTVLTLAVLIIGDDRVGTETALTMTFTTFVLLQMANAFAVRVGGGTVASAHTLTNRYLWLALVSVVVMQVVVVEVSFFQEIFDTVSLSGAQWGICVGLALTYLLVDEIRSVAERFRSRRRQAATA
jgi:Ca2+-transporting ATPase